MNNKFLIGIVVSSGLTLIVFAAIAADALLTLVGGISVLGVIVLGLAWAGSNIFSRWAASEVKLRALNYGHIEKMASHGYLPANGRYQPMMLAEPEQDIPVDVTGMTASVVAAYKQDAIELLALSKQTMPDRERSLQVAPFHKAKLSNDYFKGKLGFDRWQHAVQYLLIHQVAESRKSGNKQLGTFLVTGTVGKWYEQIKSS